MSSKAWAHRVGAAVLVAAVTAVTTAHAVEPKAPQALAPAAAAVPAEASSGPKPYQSPEAVSVLTQAALRQAIGRDKAGQLEPETPKFRAELRVWTVSYRQRGPMAGEGDTTVWLDDRSGKACVSGSGDIATCMTALDLYSRGNP